LLIILNEMGAGVKNHMSTVEEDYIAKVRASFNPEGKPLPKKGPVKPAGKPVPAAAKTKKVPETKTAAPAPEKGKPKIKPAEKPAGQTGTPQRPQPKKAAPRSGPSTVKSDVEQRRPTPVKPQATGAKPGPHAQARPQPAEGKSGPRVAAAKGRGGARTGRPTPTGGTGRPAKAAPSAQRGRPTPPVGKDDGRRSDSKTQKGRGKGKGPFNKRPQARRRPAQKPAPARPTTNVKFVQIPESITVKEFAQAIEVSASEVIKKLIGLGVMASINQEIDLDTAVLVGAEFNVTVEAAPTEEETLLVEEIEDSPESLKPRWPVVTIMGHVDHGKTSLLDAIRQTNVIASEAGGITQHIGAYQVEINDKKITFLDTPGHEAFTAMRARGAQVTDIAILVVAADDGVMPQTVEAINHGKAADVPIIVAINKIDKPVANPDRVKQELTQYGLVPEEWGGDTICVEVSALKRQGIEDLLEMILLVAEMKELKANPDRPAKGTVIEAKLDKGRGPVATVLVQNGTLKQGDTIIAGEVSGKIRALVNDKGKNVTKAGPSVPVEVVGFDDLPEAGDIFYVTDEKVARELAERRQQFRREQTLKREQRFKLEDLFARIKEGEMKDLNIVLKADVQGSVEAIQASLERLSNEEVRVKVIHGGVGGISESDVMLASASGAIIVGFNVRPDPIAKRVAEREEVDLRLYRIIYDIVDDVKKAMEGMLEPEYREVVLGRAEVRATFKVPKAGVVAGSYVTEGKITRNSEARVLRDNVVVFEGKIESLKRFKDDVREVVSGFECGIGLERFNDIKEGDIIEAFTNEEIKKSTTDDSLK
ncbi:MAG: translation initiation factor IF-2, partial [Firmicutes bacterium]|nr:translation initiation factor IF-2 [Bacillota bacterium]